MCIHILAGLKHIFPTSLANKLKQGVLSVHPAFSEDLFSECCGKPIRVQEKFVLRDWRVSAIETEEDDLIFSLIEVTSTSCEENELSNEKWKKIIHNKISIYYQIERYSDVNRQTSRKIAKGRKYYYVV